MWMTNYMVTLREEDYFNKGIISGNHQRLVNGDTYLSVRRVCSIIPCEQPLISFHVGLVLHEISVRNNYSVFYDHLLILFSPLVKITF